MMEKDVGPPTPTSPQPKSECEYSSTDEDNEADQTTADPQPVAEVPYKIISTPLEPKGQAKKRKRSPSLEDGESTWPKTQKCLDNDSMAINYKIIPGTQWDSMRVYQSFISEWNPGANCESEEKAKPDDLSSIQYMIIPSESESTSTSIPLADCLRPMSTQNSPGSATFLKFARKTPNTSTLKCSGYTGLMSSRRLAGDLIMAGRNYS
jgi:hypothetical protein